jgi:hypothetical protein
MLRGWLWLGAALAVIVLGLCLLLSARQPCNDRLTLRFNALFTPGEYEISIKGNGYATSCKLNWLPGHEPTPLCTGDPLTYLSTMGALVIPAKPESVRVVVTTKASTLVDYTVSPRYSANGDCSSGTVYIQSGDERTGRAMEGTP